MLVVVEGEKPCCRMCCLTGHISKACPGKKVVANVQPTTNTAAVAATGEEKVPLMVSGHR